MVVCRKNVKNLTDTEKKNFVKAVLALKANGKYDEFVLAHQMAMDRATPSTVSSFERNAAHRGPSFLPWHREYLRRLELELQKEVPGVAIPYWDWAEDSSLPDPSTAPVWGEDLMGGNGDSGNDNFVGTGPFAYDPSNPNSWIIIDEDGNPAEGLKRDFGSEVSALPPQGDVDNALNETPYDNPPWNRSSNPSFRNKLEGWPGAWDNPPAEGSALHNHVHRWVGGSMLPGTSPNDPVFFLHHCYVDKLWADWQALHPNEEYLPESGGPVGHNKNDLMFPWESEGATVNSVLNHRDLGSLYDTDPPIVEFESPISANLNFNDIPEGETTVRAAVFKISSCQSITLEVIEGPTVTAGTGNFDTPLGTAVVIPPLKEKGRIWISYTGTNPGENATGTVKIRCVETNSEWDLTISANTIARPKAAILLALDKSNSMNFTSGLSSPLETRLDVLKFSAPPLTEVIHENNSIGIINFDHDAYNVMPLTQAGPPLFGTGRTNAKTEIINHLPNPQGNTAIGDALELAHTLLEPEVGYDLKATVVLTDGKETAPKYISEVTDAINERVYAIGLGTPEQINPAALNNLTNGTGGYLLLTGALTQDNLFLLSKYYLQILAGIENNQIVLDPDGWLLPGQKYRIPFLLNETDISSEIILLSDSSNLISFALATPNGDIINPSIASSIPGVSFVGAGNTNYYRLTLPVPIGQTGASSGIWNILLTINLEQYYRYIKSLHNNPKLFEQVTTHGIRYNASVQSYSNLRMTANLSQNSYEPGGTFTLRVNLTEYGLPVHNRASIRAELERPDNTKVTLTLDEIEPGIFEIKSVSSFSGIYKFHIYCSGRTLRGNQFTREQLVTGSVWKGGDNPEPRSNDGLIDWLNERDERICNLLKCLIKNKAIIDFLERNKINADMLEKCLSYFCGHKKQNPKSEINPIIMESFVKLLSDPKILTIIKTLMAEKK